MNTHQNNRAFTLIELSIVLVIIGLIVGGVLVGQDLIKAAELRATTSQLTQFKTAINTYRLKYNAIAGDHKDAYDFFGGGCGTDADVTVVDAGCNGNGNKQINFTNDYGEGFRAWQHLSLAGLIEGNYTGTNTAGEGVIGTNVPPAKLKGGGYYIGYVQPSVFMGWVPTATSNYIFLGGFTTSEPPLAPILAPVDALSVDTKIDDGKPNTGKVIAGNGFPAPASNCISGTDYDADADDTKRCGIAFRLGQL